MSMTDHEKALELAREWKERGLGGFYTLFAQHKVAMERDFKELLLIFDTFLALDARTRWIPVEEGVPKYSPIIKGVRILVAYTDIDNDLSGIYIKDQLDGYYRKGDWFAKNGNKIKGKAKVTHWHDHLPLPQPPEVE